MTHTKNLNRNSQNRQSDNTWLYIFFFLTLTILAGIGIWYFWNPPQIQPNYNILGEWKANPVAEEVGGLLMTNHDLGKSIQRALISESRRKKLKNAEKNKVRNELAVISKKIKEISKDFDLNCSDLQFLTTLYSQLYEQGKLLVRLKERVADREMPYKEAKQQYSYQLNWSISDSELVEIDREMNKWITKWYNQFMSEGLRSEKNERKLTKYIRPVLIGGQEVTELSSNEIARFQKVWKYQIEHKNGLEESVSVDLGQPLQIKFDGYGGFLNEKEKEVSQENSAVLGVTLSPGPITFPENKGTNEFKFFSKNVRPIVIKLRREMFFNRLGYNIWINSLNNEGKKSYLDISFEQVIETIAHELAHAVVNSLHGEYQGEYDGEKGHGKAHDDLTDRIEEMMRNRANFSEFKSWWNKGKNDN